MKECVMPGSTRRPVFALRTRGTRTPLVPTPTDRRVRERAASWHVQLSNKSLCTTTTHYTQWSGESFASVLKPTTVAPHRSLTESLRDYTTTQWSGESSASDRSPTTVVPHRSQNTPFRIHNTHSQWSGESFASVLKPTTVAPHRSLTESLRDYTTTQWSGESFASDHRSTHRPRTAR